MYFFPRVLRIDIGNTFNMGPSKWNRYIFFFLRSYKRWLAGFAEIHIHDRFQAEKLFSLDNSTHAFEYTLMYLSFILIYVFMRWE